MTHLIKIISFIALLMVIIPSILFFMGTIDLAANKQWMLAGTVVWFALAPFWMDRKAQ